MTVQSHEPVRIWYDCGKTLTTPPNYGWVWCPQDYTSRSMMAGSWVTLSNGQVVYVRALSEERKAARAFQKRVRKAVEANR